MADKKAMEWNGYEVRLDPYRRFEVLALERSYDTWKEAQEAIDRHEQAKSRVKREKLDLAIIDQDGTERTITGVHAGHGTFLITPKVEESRAWNRKFFAATPNAKALVVKAKKLKETMDELEAQLREYRLEEKSHDRTSYDQKVAEVVAKHAECVAKG